MEFMGNLKDLESYAKGVEDYFDVGDEMGHLCVYRGDMKGAVILGAKWQKEKIMKYLKELRDDAGNRDEHFEEGAIEEYDF